MFRITSELAQPIVDAMMRDVPYGINVMDADGKIVASGTPARIGSTHQGAVHALTTGETVEIERRSRNEKRGLNMPIIFDEDRIGVVGITGDPDEVRPFAKLVCTSVTLLIRQHQNVVAAGEKEQRHRAFVDRLLLHKGNYPQEMIEEAGQYGLDLSVSHIAVLAESSTAFDFNLLAPRYPLLKGTTSSATLLLTDEAEVRSFARTISSAPLGIRFFVADSELSVRLGVEQAESARSVAMALTMGDEGVWYRDVVFLCTLTHIDIPDQGSVFSALRGHDDLVATIRALVRNNASMVKTAADLCIHRNTLTYRLGRVEELTGRDPRNLLHLFELVHDLLRVGGS